MLNQEAGQARSKTMTSTEYVVSERPSWCDGGSRATATPPAWSTSPSANTCCRRPSCSTATCSTARRSASRTSMASARPRARCPRLPGLAVAGRGIRHARHEVRTRTTPFTSTGARQACFRRRPDADLRARGERRAIEVPDARTRLLSYQEACAQAHTSGSAENEDRHHRRRPGRPVFLCLPRSTIPATRSRSTSRTRKAPPMAGAWCFRTAATARCAAVRRAFPPGLRTPPQQVRLVRHAPALPPVSLIFPRPNTASSSPTATSTART